MSKQRLNIKVRLRAGLHMKEQYVNMQVNNTTAPAQHKKANYCPQNLGSLAITLLHKDKK